MQKKDQNILTQCTQCGYQRETFCRRGTAVIFFHALDCKKKIQWANDKTATEFGFGKNILTCQCLPTSWEIAIFHANCSENWFLNQSDKYAQVFSSLKSDKLTLL